jgi:transposase
MMGRLKSDQGQLFYEFHLSDAIPEDHLVRKIDAALDLSWLRSELAFHYSSMGRPSIDPELMIRMLVVGYVFAIRSERLLCREVQVNLAYRWFCKLGIEDAIPDHSAFSRAPMSASAREMSFVAYSNVSSRRALRPVWLAAKVLQ